MLGLAAALRARGHAPVLALPPYYRAVCEGMGFAFVALEPDADPEKDAAMVRRVMDPRRGAEVIFREVLMPVLAQQYATLRELASSADLLISHPGVPAAPIAVAKTGVRWMSTVLAPLSFLSAHEPVIPPVAPWLRHLGYHRLARFADWMAGGARLVADKWVTPVYELRASLGLPRGAHPVFEGSHAPAGVLAMFSRVLAAPQPDWPPQVTITGQVRYDAAHGTALTPVLEAFLAAGAPPLVFTLGSSAVEIAGTFYDESLGAARRLGRRAVLLAGRRRTASIAARAANEGASDVMVMESAPHSLLFPRAAAVVHQCGIGTVGTALHAGVPMLAVPFANDQPDNAWRLERLGVARTLYPTRYTARRAARELDALLDTRAYADAAARVAETVRDEDGARMACDVIERVLEERFA
jgi:UDP:flavonoid glycosyltransferase YjiC (YdhE family)